MRGRLPGDWGSRTRSVRRVLTLLVMCCACNVAATPGLTPAEEPDALELFQSKVAPLLERRCLSCHGGSERKGGLSLATLADALKGGDGGEAIVPGDPDASLLLEMIQPPAENPKARPSMPKDADPLQPQDLRAIRDWIRSGAPWPKGRTLAEVRVNDRNWWSLKPIQHPALPRLAEPARALWARNPIDLFIAAKQEKLQLTPTAEADRGTLARRLSFDLTGLPPDPDEVARFIDDPDPNAYEKLVDRLLASPRFGERWARHWLDVVHFGETHGYDKDKPRPNAWPYRDYVIRSFNRDKPFDQFIKEQIAGDVLFPGAPDGVEALGFLAAGPWDFIGHAEVPESKIDGKIARHLDRDDMISTTINTFCSMTIHCSQCHNHKFDPITQEDYYSLQAVFAAIDRADKEYDEDPGVSRRRAELAARASSARAELAALEREAAMRSGPRSQKIALILADTGPRPDPAPPQHGFHSAISTKQDDAKWVQVDLGSPISITAIEIVACFDDFNQIGAGFGFPPRFKLEISDDPEFQASQLLDDQTAADVPNPGTMPRRVEVKGKTGRYLRFTATRLAERSGDYILALAELRVLDKTGANVALKRPVKALDSIEAGERWGRANLVDGIAPGAALGAAGRLALQAEREGLIEQSLTSGERTRWAQLRRSVAESEQSIAALPPRRVVYAGTVHQGAGAFAGTGSVGGKPRKIFILPRGDVTRPGPEVGPGALSALSELPSRFPMSETATEGDRRAALAGWLSSPRNPLTWRSIVNRIWLYHFGRGLVDTPNDFGRMGQPPSHPALLDWMAAELRDGKRSLKGLHRLIVTSATYRQGTSDQPRASQSDAGNVWLWRQNRRKLEAEAIRDGVLWAAGMLDDRMGGPSFQDFKVDKPEHSPHYEYILHDPDDPSTQRRSVYRFIVRSQQQPFMTTMDCADPSLLVDKRNQSVSPLQALAMLNNQLVVVMAVHFADRVQHEALGLDEQVSRAFALATSRKPTPAERDALVDHARKYGLANTCRVILNLNEFTFID